METTKLGKYELRAIIGRGAIGSVYRAWDPLIERDVAIKVVPKVRLDDPDIEKYTRFQQEARAAGRLHHPNIVATYDFGETDDVGYIVMELLPGPSLQGAMAKRTQLPLPETLTVMRGLLAGLHHSHSRSVVHRDIKPANLVFGEEGEIKITDFGVAHLESSNLTRVGSQIGTPAYMAPEQVLGEPVDARSDLYAAGVVLFEMLTGRRPFEGSTSSVLHKIVSRPPPLPSDFLPKVSPRLDSVLAKALAKSADERYQTARAFADALPAVLEDEESPSAPEDEDATRVQVSRHPTVSAGRLAKPDIAAPLPPAPPPSPIPAAAAARPSRRLPIVAAVVVLGLVIAGVAALRLSQSPPAPTGTVAARSDTAPTQHPPAPPAETTEMTPPPAVPATTPPPASPEAVPPTPPDSRVAVVMQAASAALASIPCSLITADVETTRARLGGVTALGEASDLSVQAAIQQAMLQASGSLAITWQVVRARGPYCGILDLLRSVRANAGTQAGTLSFVVQATKTAPASQILVQTPAAGAVLVDLFRADGTVTHLARRGDVAAGAAFTVAASGLALPAGPAGNGMLSLIALPSLPIGPRPDSEPAAAYLTALKPALEKMRERGVPVATSALAIDVDAR